LINPVDPLRLGGIQAFSDTVNDLDIGYALAGAMARDILLFHQYGIDTGRRTEDIDFCVLIETWDQFDTLREKLLNSGNFASSKMYHRVVYKNMFPVDFIPFGPVENSDKTVNLPPDWNFVMKMTGFQEAYSHSVLIKLSEKITVKVISLAGLAVLKVFAWDDRAISRDPQDLNTIIKNYFDAGNKERFFTEYLEVANADEFDYELANAWLLGIDIGNSFSKQLTDDLRRIIDEKDSDDISVLAMEMSSHMRGNDEAYTNNLLLLQNLVKGLLGEKPAF